MTIHVFGIRHHGPGCARSLRAALDELQPDAVVMEAPADVEDVFSLASHADMRPPVAMLVYPKDDPSRSVVYPLAVFSPEWQALRWGLERNIPVRAMDLPMAHRLALDSNAGGVTGVGPTSGAKPRSKKTGASPRSSSGHPDDVNRDEPTWRTDPLAMLAEAAGYRDHELWWEEQIERRADAAGLFEAILTAMRTVRDEFPDQNEVDLLREAYMRKTIRSVAKQGLNRIAVVCGAWHAPVLEEAAISGQCDGLKIKDDNARLKGLPKIKTVATWIPWTHSRLTYRSGYGAGVHSPGWYAHLWESLEDAPARWIVNAARLLREKDLDASAANAMEATRLADALAAIRDLRTPGLQELNEAILTVLCHGEETPLRSIRRRLEIGDKLGAVPPETQSVPLSEDLKRLQKSLRLEPSTEIKRLDLDLRQDMARERSRLLHRLNILGIAWGECIESGGRMSTFHEIWKLEWQPEFAISIIDASVWGNTVEEAAALRVVDRSRRAGQLSELTGLLDVAILSDLSAAVEPLLDRIQSLSAVATDVLHLMQATLPLARIRRYGDVRGTSASFVTPILIGMFERILVGLPAACAALDDEAAESMLSGMIQTQESLDLVQDTGLSDDWNQRVRQLAAGNVHGLLRGWCCRLLLEKGMLDAGELDSLTRRALSAGTETSVAAAWITGLLRGSGVLLLYQDAVWRVMDDWLAEMPEPTFIATLPLLRRAFSGFSPAERRQMGDRIKHLDPRRPAAQRGGDVSEQSIDHQRAAKVLPVLAHILGVSATTSDPATGGERHGD